MHATYKTHTLKFKTPSGTSRGVLNLKETWIITLKSQGKEGIGECGMFKGLSVDDRLDFETKLQWACNNIHLGCNPFLMNL